MKKVSFRNDVLPLKNELFRLALRITLNRAEAEDIVQDTLIKVWNRREEWNAIDASSNPQDRMIQTDKVRLIRQSVDGLPEKQRSCMQLRDFEGKTYKEIAGVLDISEEQVKVNIFRARQTVKQKYLKLDNYGL